MPKLGESVTEGTINSWLVKEGDFVNKYDPIAEVMTDKVNAEIPSSFTGTIKQIIVKEGETVPVDQLICYIEIENDNESEQSVEKEQSTENNSKRNSTNEQMKTDKSMKLRYSPAVLKLATEHSIDLNNIRGTGL